MIPPEMPLSWVCCFERLRLILWPQAKGWISLSTRGFLCCGRQSHNLGQSPWTQWKSAGLDLAFSQNQEEHYARAKTFEFWVGLSWIDWSQKKKKQTEAYQLLGPLMLLLLLLERLLYLKANRRFLNWWAIISSQCFVHRTNQTGIQCSFLFQTSVSKIRQIRTYWTLMSLQKERPSQ